MQSILDSWLVGDDTLKLCNYMCLDWSNQKVNWTYDKPKELNFKKKIKWRSMGIEILVCGNITNNKTKCQYNYIHTPILKSNLQKCIRRGLTKTALSTAKVMIKTDFIELIRRLSIIMLEDCTLHESFNILVWMIAAYPDWQPTKCHANWLLSLVKYLSNLKVRDLYLKEEFDFKTNLKEINLLTNCQKNLIYSMYFRTSYGGMKCDMLMIKYLIKLWINRFETNTNLDNIYTPIIPYTEKILNIKTNQIELSAVDFHCYPQILNLIQYKFDDYEIEDIKNAIWYYRSSKNNKIIINTHLNLNDFIDYDKKYLNIWTDIKTEVENLSKYFISKLN